MARRRQPSTIDRLPKETQELIGNLRTVHNRTIDEIHAKLNELGDEALGGEAAPSRSALGRHVKKLADVGDTMRRSRLMADALVDRFGEEPDDRLSRVNMELMHDITFRMLTAAEPDPETGELGEVTMTGLEAGRWAGVLDRLTRSRDTNSKRTERERQENEKRAAAKATKEAAANAVTAARTLGLSKEGVAAIRHAVLGSDG